ncbi:hypothetical protein JYP52_01405 [Nitratireductor aquibiodomus]|uniref:hypothetical protein n=1 Tax=Nitratireductor aquibiodomus TaxID=204799 RepID=UPI0019D37347|nr:hypothetical protein [Nitratireductor aquibiodomus]MBN7759779.1 hypothetical protein [Nitratireductor aquibiodomus]
MVSLGRTAKRFHSTIVKENGQPFLGTIMPVGEGKVPSYDFSTPRLLLRTTEPHTVSARSIILDDTRQRYIVADHGHSAMGGHFTYRLFQVTADLQWTRTRKETDPLTGIEKTVEQQDLGVIPCLIEMMGREYPDRATQLTEETRRVIAAADLQLGDQLDDAVVRRVDRALGVTYAEIS